MPGPDLSNLKAVVGDLVNRQAKFGSFKASKAALDKKYMGSERNSAEDSNDYSIYYKNGTEIAVAAKDDSEGAPYIRDNANRVAVVYSGRAWDFDDYGDGNTFVRMSLWMNDCGADIYDINHNGIVDGKDKITIWHEGNTIVNKKTIAEFLGLKSKGQP